MSFFDLKVNGNKKRDPLDIDIKETGKSIVKGVIVLAVGVPLLLGASSLLGGSS